MLTVIVVLSMSLASFASNANATQFNSNGSNIAIENADPHTKQYDDIKKILDEYEEAIKKATTCEELDNAELAMLFKLMALTENEYSEDAIDLLYQLMSDDVDPRRDFIMKNIDFSKVRE